MCFMKVGGHWHIYECGVSDLLHEGGVTYLVSVG